MDQRQTIRNFYDYYEFLVRFVANQMVDPHRYFEQKLMGEMQLATTMAEENELLATVLQWLEDGLLSRQQVKALDRNLVTKSLPSLDFARAYPQALRQLLEKEDSDECLRAILDEDNLLPRDRQLIEKRLAKN